MSLLPVLPGSIFTGVKHDCCSSHPSGRMSTALLLFYWRESPHLFGRNEYRDVFVTLRPRIRSAGTQNHLALVRRIQALIVFQSARSKRTRRTRYSTPQSRALFWTQPTSVGINHPSIAGCHFFPITIDPRQLCRRLQSSFFHYALWQPESKLMRLTLC